MIYVNNPKAFQVEVGQTVHCSYSGRPIVVARKDQWGYIWEAIEKDHPYYPHAQEPKQRYISHHYREFEPAFKAKETK